MSGFRTELKNPSLWGAVALSVLIGVALKDWWATLLGCAAVVVVVIQRMRRKAD